MIFFWTNWLCVTTISWQAEAPNTPQLCGGGSWLWGMWVQTNSMASCLISTPGNSANTDSILQAKIRSCPWTNKQTIAWDACDGGLWIWYGIPDIFTHVKFTSLQVISLWQEKCDDIWCRIYLLANIWLCIILICFSSYRGHYSSLPYGFPQHCDWDSASGVRRNAFIRYLHKNQT